MNIIIFGASGKTGVHLVRQALIRGHHVTAFVRRRESIAHLRHDNLKINSGNINNTEQVTAAMARQDVVLCALGVSRTLHHDPDVISGVATIVAAMKQEGVTRIIYLSVFLAYARQGQFGFFASNILRRIIRAEVEDHEQKEQIIRQHAKAYTIVRATRLTGKPLSKQYRHGVELSSKEMMPSIGRADVAHMMLKQLDDLTYMNKTVVVTSL